MQIYNETICVFLFLFRKFALLFAYLIKGLASPEGLPLFTRSIVKYRPN